MTAVADDAPLLLKRAAELAFPDGSISGQDLRRLTRARQLTHYIIGGGCYTTLGDIKALPSVVLKFPEPGETGLVYVVGFGNYVKIGFTGRNLNKRLSQLRTGAPEPVVVYGVVPGTRADEKAMHAKFQRHRLQGEWFKKTKSMRDWIAAGCPL
jgi:hypothetical protein